ncbi:DUF2312 domain-containing protein [Sphingomonas sp. 3-13AW]|uniref:DUF2312 domain-containing protein n=1 Tax=Sphingomonas sp. 3-13AW TaxID=3050450 RepID=UPI003BB6A856
MLVGREEITLEEVEQGLPATIRSGRPTHKSMTKALIAAGWVGVRRAGGAIVYRAPDAPKEDGGDPARGIGDNSTREQLRLYFERIERLKKEHKGISDDIKDVFAEAKSMGFDTTAMRAVLKRRGTDREKRIELDALVDLYAAAGGVADVS